MEYRQKEGKKLSNIYWKKIYRKLHSGIKLWKKAY